MRNFFITLVINMLSIAVTAWLLPGILMPDSLVELAVIALIFGVINAFVRPILTLLSLPFIVVTLGLFIFILNGLLLALTAAITPLDIASFWWAVLGGIVIGIVNMILYGLVTDESKQRTA